VSHLLAPKPARRGTGLAVGAVMDVMTRESFGPECSLITFRPDNWRETLSEQAPELLFVESAWEGNQGSWQYKVGTYSHRDSIGLPDLKALVEWSRSRGVPTVFWNKEDPIHFDKFKEAAALFDAVFTTDARCIGRYEQLAPHLRRAVRPLMFAAQPTVHNPVALSTPRSRTVCFAGTYYRQQHFDRQPELEALLDGARAHGLEIYDRTSGANPEIFGFPSRFAPHLRDGVPYEEILRVYKQHRVFLNTNSVMDSPTMFSRRVFELLACGTPVVSTRSSGMSEVFGDIIATVASREEADRAIGRLLDDDDHWLDVSQRGIRAVLGRHTYRHRFADVTAAVGLPSPDVDRPMSLAIDVAERSEVEPTIRWLTAQTLQPAEVIVLGDSDAAERVQRAVTGAKVIAVPSDGDGPTECSRRVARAAAHDWTIYVRDPPPADEVHVVEDLALATTYCRADVIGLADTAEDRHTYSVPRLDVVAIPTKLVRARGLPADAADAEAWRAEGNACYAAEPISGT
jgi:hypothetical protein